MRAWVLVFVFALSLSAPAAVKVWTNSASGAWSAAANWDPNGAPSAGDVAVITNQGIYTVTLDSSPALAGLVLGGGSGTQSLATAEQTLVLNGAGRVAPSGRFVLCGTLSGTNHLVVEGSVLWTYGTVDAFAAVEVGSNGSLVIGGDAEFAKALVGTITNSGTVIYKPYGPLVISGTLCNLIDGQFIVQSPNRSIVRGQAAGLIINQGLFQVASGGLNCGVPLVNSGTVDTQVGTLTFGDGCVFNDGSRFTGAGVTRLDSGTNILNGSISSENLVFQGASLRGTAALSGTVTWGAGCIDEGAGFLLAGNAQLYIGGGANYGRILCGSLTNAGTIVYAPPGPLGLAGPLHNLKGGVLDIRWSSTISRSGPAGLLLNEGTLRISGDTRATCEVPVVNSGIIENQSGVLALGDGCVFNDGTRFAGAGVTRLDSGTNFLNGDIYSENLLLQGATVNGTAALSGTVGWGAGEIGDGTGLLLKTNAQLFIGGGANYGRILRGSLTNAGTIIYAPPGPLGLAGPLHNLQGALFDIQWNAGLFRSGPAGMFVNEGTLRKSQGVAGATCEVPLLNNGTVDTQTGSLVFGDGCVFNDGTRFTGAGVTRLDSGTNVLNGNIYSENLLLQGATVNGTASLTGTVTWGAGEIGDGAGLLLKTNAQLFIGGGANYGRILRGSLTNAGTILYAPPGLLSLAGPLYNLQGAVFDIQWNAGLFRSGPAGVFLNEGTLRKSEGVAGATCEVPLINSGTVDTQTGALLFGDGCIFNDGTRFTGAGVSRLESGTNFLNGSIYSENLLLQGATVNGTASLTGTVTWGAGEMGDGADVLVATNGQLVIGGGANFGRILRGSLNNAGTIVYEPPGPLGLAGPLHNLAGGLFEIHWDYGLFNSGPEGAFINDGTCRKSAGVGTTECQVPFSNRGTLDIASGRFYFSGAYNQPSGDLLLHGGKVRSDQPLSLAGGRLLGWGTVEADNLINAGATVSPSSSNGVLTVTGNYAQQISGSIEFTLGGTSPGTNLSQFQVAGAAQLSGTVVVGLLQSYLPTAGDAYPVMSFASRRGDFARRNGLILLGHNLRLVTTYGARTLSLVVVAEPDPEGVALQIGFSGNAALVSWPLEFGGGTLYACTNLAAPAWVVVPTINNCFLDQPMIDHRWFRLQIP